MSASAAKSDVGQLTIYEQHAVLGKTIIGSSFTYTTGNGEAEKIAQNYSTNKAYLNTSNKLQQYLIVKPLNGGIIAESKIKTTITLENVYTSYLLSGDTHVYAYSPNYVQFEIYYIDGTTEFVTGSILGTTSDFEKTYKVTFTPDKDVKHFVLRVQTPLYETIPDGWDSFGITAYSGETNGDGRIKLTVDQPSEEAGLLEGIWGSLASGFDNLSQKLQSVVDTIVNLPSKIWGFIENGLKSLFVPSDEAILEFKTNWDNLASEKMGAMYEVADIVTDSWGQVQASDASNTIHIPEVTINLPGNNKFSFGGYNVKIVPDKFETFVELLKIAVAIVCTLLCINALRDRFERTFR